MSPYEIKSNHLGIRILMVLLASGPLSRVEMCQRLHADHDKITQWLDRMRETQPYQLVYIKRYVRNDRGYPVAVYALNLNAGKVKDAERPDLSESTVTALKRREKFLSKFKPAGSEVSEPVETSTPAPAPSTSRVRSRGASHRPSPESLPVSSIFDLASRHKP